MATTNATAKPARAAASTELDLCLGQTGQRVGRLIHVKQGQREFSQFSYAPDWLASTQVFDVSPDLDRVPGWQLRKPTAKEDSCFFLALADTEPDTWGRRVIARAHAKARRNNPGLPALTELDYLSRVDDASRIGALRLRNAQGTCLASAEPGQRNTPVLLELDKVLAASRAVELSRETLEDLRYLQGKATSLGGLRPKCTLLDADGSLALGKFPSVQDERSVTRGEVLALRLAQMAGIDTASARIETVQGSPVVVVRRFDRTADKARIPYLSGASMLQARRGEERAYTELVDAMRAKGQDFQADARALWRRVVFNFLITNVDDHLHNLGFLYAGRNQWRLAPAFDLNPFPDKDRESKTWLSEDSGPVGSVQQLMEQAPRFELNPRQALVTLGQVVQAVEQWREVALSARVGMTPDDLTDFESAFEHEGLEEARAQVAGKA
jgi:serine/threonine-protein kinase HipA